MGTLINIIEILSPVPSLRMVDSVVQYSAFVLGFATAHFHSEAHYSLYFIVLFGEGYQLFRFPVSSSLHNHFVFNTAFSV